MGTKLLSFIFIFFSFLSFSEEDFLQEDLKVGIGRFSSETLRIKGQNGPVVLTYNCDGKLFEDYFKEGDPLKLTYEAGKISYMGKAIEEVMVYKGEPETLISLSRDGKNYHSYRGDFQFVACGNKIFPINQIQSEEYLYSVVPSEIGTYFPEEAIKAQAVAARTYLYYNLRNSKYSDFDLLDNTSSQMYLGYDKENEKIRKLVDETMGEIMTYSGLPINALYHSTSGGSTANNEDVWGGKPIPYLRAIDDGKNGWESPRNSWTYMANLEELSEKFGFRVKDIKILEKTNGRVMRVAIKGEKTIIISGNSLRREIGYTNIFSTMFEIERKGSIFVFRGHGSGHGVGMSQWGANTLAKNGKRYTDILKFYYSNIEIKSLKKTKNVL